MLIIDLVRLLKGELANRPAISQIYGFSFEAKRIKQGFAFIATQADEDEIATAIKNGAYAIVYDEQVSIIDTEIAYIKVENLRSSLFRLMRYLASQKNIRFFYVNPMQMAMLERLNLGKNATLMSENIDELFDKILRANSNECFFGSHTRTLERISPFYDQVFSDTKITPINPSSIFFSSFICDEIFYQNLNIPRVFLPAFCGLLKFLNKNEISFRVNETKNLGHFEPIFIDKNFRPANFGSSFRAIITESDEELFYVESAFLQKNFSADEIIFCLPKDTNIKLENAFYFENLNELKELKNFRYALVLAPKSDVLSVLDQQKPQENLFSHFL